MRAGGPSALLVLAALAAGRAPQSEPGDERLRFGIEPGVSLAKRFETSFRLRVEDAHASVEGADANVPSSAYPRATDVETREVLRVNDRYLECAPTGPRALERSFLEWRIDDARGEIAGPDGVGAALEGAVVRFAESAPSEWTREPISLREGVLPEDLALEKLAADLDFTLLLPPAVVEIGASWEVPLERAQDLVMPGLDARRTIDVEEPSLLASLGELPAGSAAPALRCTFVSIDRVDERDLATIALALSFDGALQPGAAARETLARRIAGGARLTVESLTHELELRAEGRLVWDLEAGRFQSFDLQVDLGLTRAWTAALDRAGSSTPLSSRERFHATIVTSARLE